MLNEVNKQMFLDACYKAGVEWAKAAREADSEATAETGMEESYWNNEDANDYVTLHEVAEGFDINIFNEYYLRKEASAALYKGCFDGWSKTFGRNKSASSQAQAPQAKPVPVDEPVVPPTPKPEPVKPLTDRPISHKLGFYATSSDIQKANARVSYGKGVIKYTFPDGSSLVRSKDHTIFGTCKNPMCFCELVGPCKK